MSLFSASSLEAPNRKFIGHRDCLVRNMSRYQFVAPRAHGRCLDIGCGRGYGFDYLKGRCTDCTGIEVSAVFLAEARVLHPEITLICQTAERLPFKGASFDFITCFEVIEHIQDDRDFLREIERVSTSGAVVAISTPNKVVSSGGRSTPLNKFHTREYTAAEFRSLLEERFADVVLYGQIDDREGSDGKSGTTKSLIDRIPVSWKYLLPFYVQDIISTLLRPPLKMEQCKFLRDAGSGHTLLAICRPKNK